MRRRMMTHNVRFSGRTGRASQRDKGAMNPMHARYDIIIS